jgi:serpin B
MKGAPKALVFMLMLGSVGLIGCGRNDGEGVGEQAKEGTGGQTIMSDQTKAVVAGNNAFALELYGQLKGTSGNLFFSPYSISSCLAMVYAGARGSTEKQMAGVLHFGTNQVQAAFGDLQRQLNQAAERKGIDLHTANGLWVQQGQTILPAFLDIARQQYDANVKQCDFASEAETARADINSWVKGKTKGAIGDIIPSGMLNRDSRLVLVNAIYFKGVWRTKFDPKFTKDSNFHVDDEHEVQCPTMFCSGKFLFCYGYRPPCSCEVLELPYVGKDLSLFVILPQKPDGLADLENNLTDKYLAALLASVQETDVAVKLPKFRFQAESSLDKVLPAMGLSEAFTANADFSGIDGRKILYLSSVRHRAFVEVTEEGTTAAAATTAHLMELSATPIFQADHPFLFLIRDNRSGSILFMGRLVDPTKSVEINAG